MTVERRVLSRRDDNELVDLLEFLAELAQELGPGGSALERALAKGVRKSTFARRVVPKEMQADFARDLSVMAAAYFAESPYAPDMWDVMLTGWHEDGLDALRRISHQDVEDIFRHDLFSK